MSEVRLTEGNASTAEGIQRAIDELAARGGGTVVLPELNTVLDRGLQLRTNVTLSGQNDRTVLRKSPARVYRVATYHNYGMYDLPMETTSGLAQGMTVAIRDERRGGFQETFARITWVEDHWIGLDRGLESDYGPDHPVLMTSYPLVYAEGVENAALRCLSLDGGRDADDAAVGACRGAAVYLYRSTRCEISDVAETGFLGEGIGMQLCRDITVRRCRVSLNGGNGLHPGAGSTGVLFEDCASLENDADGFFFCVRANHITVRNSDISRNGRHGIVVGTRDCNNLIQGCSITGNQLSGICFPQVYPGTEPHSCRVEGCRVIGNGTASAHGQVEIHKPAHDLVIRKNHFGGCSDGQGAGIWAEPGTANLWLANNTYTACEPETAVDSGSKCMQEPTFTCGHAEVQEAHLRHLGGLPAKNLRSA